MILYHGTNCIIDKIDLNKCRPFKDFGKGFYLTTIKEQAEKMAQRVSRIYGGKPVANDDLALLFRQFSNGMIEIDTLIREMKYKKLTDQYSFHTEKGLQFLKKEGEYSV